LAACFFLKNHVPPWHGPPLQEFCRVLFWPVRDNRCWRLVRDLVFLSLVQVPFFFFSRSPFFLAPAFLVVVPSQVPRKPFRSSGCVPAFPPKKNHTPPVRPVAPFVSPTPTSSAVAVFFPLPPCLFPEGRSHGCFLSLTSVARVFPLANNNKNGHPGRDSSLR